MNITQLRQKKADALKAARAIHTLAESQNRLCTAEENTAFEAHMTEASSYDAPIAQKEALMAAERVAPSIVPPGNSGTGASAGHNNAQDRPWASAGEQLMAIKDFAIAQKSGMAHNADQRLYGAQGASESVDPDGGFLIAPEFAGDFLQRTYQEGQVTSRCTTKPVKGSRIIFNGLNEDSRLPGFRYGGISVYRLAEAALYTSSKPNFRQVQLNMNKLIGLMYATDEVLEDTDFLSAWADEMFPKAFAFQLDDEAVNGSGSGQMLGFLNSGALLVQPKDSGQATNTISTANILGIWSQMWAPSRKNSVWFINQAAEPSLYTLSIPGAMGTAVALYVMPGDRGNNSEYGTIMGRPVIPIEQAAAFSSQGDISLCDMSQYIIGQRQGVQKASSIHVAFLTGEQAFRWTLRNDGQPIPKLPLTPYKGNLKTSPFVTLAAR